MLDYSQLIDSNITAQQLERSCFRIIGSLETGIIYSNFKVISLGKQHTLKFEMNTFKSYGVYHIKT